MSAPASNELNTCDHCGAVSAVATGYVVRRRSFRSSTSRLCPRCVAAGERRRQAGGLLGWVVSFVGLALIDRRPWLAANGILWLIILMASTFPHELGHALVGRAVGLYVMRIRIGFGRIVLRRTILGIPVEVAQLPIGGLTFVIPKRRAFARLRVLASVLAGPAVNLAIVVAVAAMFPERLDGERFARGFAPVTAVFYANLCVLAVNLVPYKVTTMLGDRIWTDGGLLLTIPFLRPARVDALLASYFAARGQACREAGDLRGSRRWARHGLSRYPENQPLAINYGVSLSDMHDYDGARDVYGRLLEQELEPGHRAVVLNNLACTDFYCERFAEADEASAEAIRLVGWLPALMGTRGSVLVAVGRAEEGQPLLERAFAEPDARPRDIAVNACSLALARLQLGDRAGAEAYAATARQLDPDCRLHERVERAFAQAASVAAAAG